jgi:hypothetical protein
MGRGLKLDQDKQREMLSTELRCRGNFYYSWAKNSMVKAGEEESREPAPYETPPANGECLVFIRLPPGKQLFLLAASFFSLTEEEIRAIILRILFVRPCKVLPSPVRYKLSICYRDTTLNIYSYLWDDYRQSMYDEAGLPAYDGELQGMTKQWVTTATPEQLSMIAAGEIEVDHNDNCKLPATFDEEIGHMVEHYICHRGPYPTKIVNRAIVWTTGIQGVNILATCKQFLNEGAPILYGENQFAIDTRGQHPFTHRRGVHEHDSLDSHGYLVPGLQNNDGTESSYRQSSNAVAKMFRYKSMHQPFMRRDPLATFLRKIGPKNASFITNVTIQGFFKTAENNSRYRDNRPITFAKILPIHATILQHACPNLKRLAIYQGYNNSLWEDDLEDQLGYTDEQRYEEVIDQVVHTLPGLQVLELANYDFTTPKNNPEEDDLSLPWGIALRWEAIVENRYRQKKTEQRLKEEREANRLEVDHYVWKDDNSGNRGGRVGRRRRGGRGGRKSGDSRVQSSINSRYNDSFAAMVDVAVTAAAEGNSAGGSGARPSFRRGKKLARGGN